MAGTGRVYRFGVYEADVRSGELRKGGQKLRLQDQPFQVLAVLLEQPGQVVTREELRQRMWPADTFVDFDHSLNTAINKLREALGDSAANPRFIETLAKRGYRFIAPVQGAEAGESPHPVSPTPGETRVEQPENRPPTAAECAVAVAKAEERRPEMRATHSTQATRLAGELPVIDRGVGRGLFGLIQLMYVCFYIASMWKLGGVGRVAERMVPRWDWVILVVVVISAVLGIPTRLYLLSAVTFDFAKLGDKFRRLFPFLLPLDELWALSPFLVQDKIGFGLAFAATAALLYLPFSQRTLMRMTYPVAS